MTREDKTLNACKSFPQGFGLSWGSLLSAFQANRLLFRIISSGRGLGWPDVDWGTRRLFIHVQHWTSDRTMLTGKVGLCGLRSITLSSPTKLSQYHEEKRPRKNTRIIDVYWWGQRKMIKINVKLWMTLKGWFCCRCLKKLLTLIWVDNEPCKLYIFLIWTSEKAGMVHVVVERKFFL